MTTRKMVRKICKTKRQARKFLWEQDIIIKNGVLYRVPSMIVAYGYVERLHSGAFTVCVSAKEAE